MKPAAIQKIGQVAQYVTKALKSHGMGWGPEFGSQEFVGEFEHPSRHIQDHFEDLTDKQGKKFAIPQADSWTDLHAQARKYLRRENYFEGVEPNHKLASYFYGRFSAFLDLQGDPDHHDLFYKIQPSLLNIAKILRKNLPPVQRAKYDEFIAIASRSKAQDDRDFSALKQAYLSFCRNDRIAALTPTRSESTFGTSKSTLSDSDGRIATAIILPNEPAKGWQIQLARSRHSSLPKI